MGFTPIKLFAPFFLWQIQSGKLNGKGGFSFLVTAIPCGFLMVLTFWASIINHMSFVKEGNITLILLNGVIIVMSFFILGETLFSFFESFFKSNKIVKGSDESC